METFGEKLREAIEGLDVPLEEVAQATGFDVQHLQALERDDHGACPDDAFVIEHLPALARLLHVDPSEVIDDYRAERARHRRADSNLLPAEPAHDLPPRPAVVRERAAARPPEKPWFLTASLAAMALVVVGFWWLGVSGASSESLVSMLDTTAPVGARTGDSPVGAEDPTVPSVDRKPPTPKVEGTPSPGLTIPRHGVGTGVVDHELIGEARQFAEGSRVWFWTEVEGAGPGEAIRHVWLHDGREAFSVSLRLGGARWRTQSSKNLHQGSQGNWVVEARDASGQVLARTAFRCSPRAEG